MGPFFYHLAYFFVNPLKNGFNFRYFSKIKMRISM